jgi:high-affinity nickel-transport protein
VLSGLTIAVLGIYMLMRRLTGTATDHSHVSGGRHIHFSFLRRNADGNADLVSAEIDNSSAASVSLTQLFTLGITGGIIPCPAALIVLLSAFALHRIPLGFFLIVAFSVGLAAVLIGFGMAMVYARRFLSRFQADGPIIVRWLPVVSSACVTILGVVVAVQSFATTTLSTPLWASMTWFSKEKLGPLLFVIGLGLILGMRHSTDADHVVAISTIVSKQRSIRGAALIGSVWGLGHTITIFIVGALIILFSVQIPVRVGLSMELSVAVMLVILGLLNLSGLMQKITSRFTPSFTTSKVDNADVFTTSAAKSIRKTVRSLGLYQCIRPLVIGLVHGLAGSAAVALLVLSTIHDPRWATLYLLIFGAGTMVGMMCMTTAIAVPLRYAGNRFGQLSRYLGAMSGIVSVCFGSFLIYQLGFLGGLFTSHPQWTPR